MPVFRPDISQTNNLRLAERSFGKSRAGSFSDPEGLARAAGERLAEGDSQAAFALADRRCRLIVPSARDLFLRAQTHKAAGRLVAAQRDLAAAMALDPTDVLIDRAALAWGDEASRHAAAERILARDAPDWPLRRQAAAAWFEAGAKIAHRLRRTPAGVAGWLAWASLEPLRIEATGDGETHEFLVDPDPDHPLATPERGAADVAIELTDDGPLALTLHAAGAVERADPAGTARPRPPTLKPRAAATASTPFVTVITPVYEDYEATRACLESLQRARPSFAHRLIVVDDASPNAALKAWLDEAAARGEFELLRNAVNQGFAAAVNRALGSRKHGDALLLNADALLPPGAIDRLRALSRAAPDIGAVTPFSNNGELTSWPVRNEVNPLPTAAEIEALDVRARAVNGDALVDIPNGIGFCLYITEACLDALGGLPEIYAQGYYEDVEFCLVARERGFRNVAAPGMFVGHAGSRSFGARKRALVARNLALVEARFPGYRLETAAFVTLDPLAPYRAALDAVSPPAGPVVIVACGPGAAAAWGRRRAAALKAEAADNIVLTLSAAAHGRSVALSAVGGGAPQSLRFDFARDAAQPAFADYIGRLDVSRIEWFDPASLPEEALAALIARGAPGDLYCGELAWFSPAAPAREGPCLAAAGAEPCETCRGRAVAPADDAQAQQTRRFRLGRALERSERIVPLDSLAESFALRVFKARVARRERPAAAPAEPRGAIARVAALYPFRSAEGDRLLLRVGRRLAAEGRTGELVVFGATMDDEALMATGKVFVAGPVAAEDYLELARDYGVDALLAPGRGGGYGDLEETAAALGLRKAYFDWSFGAFPVEWGDLSLDPRICEEKAAAEIVAWINEERLS
jgi:GT2 family glycosyltransferase